MLQEVFPEVRMVDHLVTPPTPELSRLPVVMQLLVRHQVIPLTMRQDQQVVPLTTQTMTFQEDQ
jgi:hypothetical protein